MKKLTIVLVSLFLFACVSISEIKTVRLNCPVETGIAVSKHVLVVRSPRCCDDAHDKKANHYYCYIIDRKNGLRAMLTKATLRPAKKLDKDIQEFYSFVEKEIKKDGGVRALIKRFSQKGPCGCRGGSH